ncbi:hypothetical protein B484DRAFT_27520 [Ochromonadaceae sp. CCMP2298]|nr:hypothetical protein B484DRAFT_27520 [Ochromonadaceae sp. CCMP2298]
MNVVIALLSIVLRWLSRTEAQKAAEDAKMPQATIHIGPPKTASSAIEGVMKRPESYVSMSAQNTYWPDYKGRVIEQSKVVEFAYALFDGKDSDQFVDSIAQMGLFFNESLRMGHDVIMSCEQFLNIPPHMILQLKAMLRGFDVTVVAVYREYISHLVSWYKFSNRWMDGHTLRFSKYLLQGMDGMRDEGFLKLCEDWQVLGRLVIVDYYGSIAAGKYTYCLTILRYTPIYTPIYDSQDTP